MPVTVTRPLPWCSADRTTASTPAASSTGASAAEPDSGRAKDRHLPGEARQSPERACLQVRFNPPRLEPIERRFAPASTSRVSSSSREARWDGSRNETATLWSDEPKLLIWRASRSLEHDYVAPGAAILDDLTDAGGPALDPR